MSVVYSTSLKNTRLNAVTTAIGSTGHLLILNSSGSTLVDVPLANPAAPAASSGVLTFTMPQSASAAASGTATQAKFTDGTNDVITGLTVGTSGTDITLNSTSISSGQSVTINSASITAG